jgi:hypothetical protein
VSRRRRHSPLVREAVAVLAAHNRVADVDLAGSGHFKITWVAGGRKHLLVISRSPGDHRSAANARATLKRLLAQEA